MRRIRSKNTAPELAVRKLLRELGHTGYRIHRKDLPGKPDIAFLGKRKAILVHGCFWHGHNCEEGARRPKSNEGYWSAKIVGNQLRDVAHAESLDALGWSVLTLWECELRDRATLIAKIAAFMSGP
ncbi:very short patch repair endonuclease [Paraburkholderia sp. D15]|nr:very short patch repair endonuclease [Paraburkholderia sp. D15]WGS51897.1 very short patch repair endonuclease [Paraburkholderia sp. D15]